MMKLSLRGKLRGGCGVIRQIGDDPCDGQYMCLCLGDSA